MSYPFVIQGSNVTVVIGNTPHTISKTHITYQKVVDAIKASDWELVKQIIDPVKVVLNYGKGNVSIQGSQLFWKGEPFNGGLATRMINMLEEGFNIEPMVHFMENLMQNPSKRAVTELYGFLEKNSLPITPDGYFLAYKRVREDFLDCHSGTMNNAPGQVVEMERNRVDDNKDNTCSTGLHFCSQEYLKSFGGARTVIVKINPADVVSIPSDYNNSKGRACRYEVISELGVSEEDAFTRPVQAEANRPMKTGTSAFYQGYTAGFQGNVNNTDSFYGKDRLNYREGFEKGVDDRQYGNGERYRYVGVPAGWTRHADGKVSPPPGTVFTAQTAAWPSPKKD
jgi:hypothetical protein